MLSEAKHLGASSSETLRFAQGDNALLVSFVKIHYGARSFRMRITFPHLIGMGVAATFMAPGWDYTRLHYLNFISK